MARGCHKWIPPDLLKVLNNVKNNYEISKDVDGFRKLGELSIIGLEVENKKKKIVIEDLFNGRKSNIMDVGFAAISLFLIGIILLVSVFTYNTYYDKATNITEINESAPALAAMKDAQTVINTRLDKIIFGMLIGLALAIIITGWFVANNPLFLFIYFIVLVIFVIVSSILSFAWNKISIVSSLSKMLQYLPITDHILGNLAIYVTVIGFLGMLVSFAKPYIGTNER